VAGSESEDDGDRDHGGADGPDASGNAASERHRPQYREGDRHGQVLEHEDR
jgi:hypothetical protein